MFYRFQFLFDWNEFFFHNKKGWRSEYFFCGGLLRIETNQNSGQESIIIIRYRSLIFKKQKNKYSLLELRHLDHPIFVTITHTHTHTVHCTLEYFYEMKTKRKKSAKKPKVCDVSVKGLDLDSFPPKTNSTHLCVNVCNFGCGSHNKWYTLIDTTSRDPSGISHFFLI